MKKHKAVILAAGYGKRMLPLTNNTPKPLLPDIDNSLLKKQINFLKLFDLDISVTIGFQKEKMLKALKQYGIEDFIYSEDKGNAYWLNKIEINDKNSPVIVITSDNLMKININSLVKEYYTQGEKSLIVATQTSEGIHDTLEINDNNEILSMNYKKPIGKIASGLQILNTLDLKNESSDFDDFHEVWSILINKKKLKVSEIKPEKWISVDTVSDLNKLQSINS